MSTEHPSTIFCSSVLLSPDPAHLTRIRSSLIHDPHLADLRQGLTELPGLWPLLIAKEPSLQCVDAAPLLLSLTRWLQPNNSFALPVAGRTSRNTRTAIFTILAHIVEYVNYLNTHDIAHSDGREGHDSYSDLLKSLTDGGVQGLCVGMLSAIALASSPSKGELAKNAAVALRLALCIGAFVDLDEAKASETTVCLSARWPLNEGNGRQGAQACGHSLKAVLDVYPQAYVGVRTDVSSTTLTVPKANAISLTKRLEEEGFIVKPVDLQGRYHHQKHEAALRKLVDICASLPLLRFPQNRRLLVPVRRNDSGEAILKGEPLHEVAIRCILVETADWHTTVSKSVASIARTQGVSATSAKNKARVLVLGTPDCVPRSFLAMSPVPMTITIASQEWQHSYLDQSIAIIGTSSWFPGLENPKEFWETLKTRRTVGSEENIDLFDSALFRKSPREAEYMDPQHRLGLRLAYEALESGGYFSPSSSSSDDVGCYVGMSSCDYEQHVNARQPTAFSFTGTARAFASGRISHFFGLTGPSMIIDTACSSSGVAIHTACSAILSGDCSMALAGGINLIIPGVRLHDNLAAASFLSPTGQCSPFDAKADGYRRGQGGGFVLLKRLSAAVADNDFILGVVNSSAINNSKGNRSITLPSSDSQTALYRRVLDLAEMQPLQISYIEAHGTGTQKGDPIECQSIRSVFGRIHRPRDSPVRFGSVKGNIGHTEAASGIAALAKVLLMLQHRMIPPQANFSKLNPAIPALEEAGLEISAQLEPWRTPFRAALVNNYGASGVNAAMVVSQPPLALSEWKTREDQPHKTVQYPILISAHSTGSLLQYNRTLLDFINSQDEVQGNELLSSIAFHLACRQNQAHAKRVQFAASSIEELKSHLGSQIHAEGQNYDTHVIKSTVPQNGPKPVVLVFAGQTGRQPCLSQDLYLSSFLLRNHLDRCDRTLQTLGLHSLYPSIFQADGIDDLVDLHCKHFALQYSVAMSWIDAGLKISTMVGHSLGQLTALCVSGVLDLRDALTLISGRANLIQAEWGADPGCMLSVDADMAAVEAILETLSSNDTVEVACYNSLSHHVVVGSETAIAAFEKVAGSRGISTKRLAITHGFHSEMVDRILPEYHRLIQGLTLRPPIIPIEACSKFSGSWENITAELIVRQSREPVYFADAISRVEGRLGPCTWLEAGSGSAGITMASRALTRPSISGGAPHCFYPTRLNGSEATNSLVEATLKLWREGVRVQFWLFHASQRRCFAPLKMPSYQFERYHHWLPLPLMPKEIEPHQDKDRHELTDSSAELVSLIGPVGELESDTVEFSINQHSAEYSTIVGGRTVFGQLLAPSSVHVESAARAFSLLPSHKLSTRPLPLPVEVEQVKIHAPFGLDHQKQLLLTLRRRTDSTWGFTVESCLRKGADRNTSTLHASGSIRWQGRSRPYLEPHRPLVRGLYDRCREIQNDNNASVVQGAFLKNILNRVANYSDDYMGIQSITSRGLEAVGTVQMPETAPHCAEGVALIPPIFDNFLLVGELHASSVGDSRNDHVYICGGFDAICPEAHPDELDYDVNAKSKGPWTVLSCLDKANDKTLICDIFVFNEGHKTVRLAILGARFTQVSILSLQKALKLANGTKQVGGKLALETQPKKLLVAEQTMVSPFVAPSDSTALNCLDTDSLLIQDDALRYFSMGPISQRQAPYPTMDNNKGVNRGRPRFRTDDGGKDSGISTRSLSTAGVDTPDQDRSRTDLLELLSEHLNLPGDFSPDTPLGTWGLDSLVAIQLQSDMERLRGKKVKLLEIDENSTFADLCGMLLDDEFRTEPQPSFPFNATTTEKPSTNESKGHNENFNAIPASSSIGYPRPTSMIAEANLEFKHFKEEVSLITQNTGFAGFFSGVHQKQLSLVLSYILEAFSNLGCDLESLQEGDVLPPFEYLPKYDQLMSRFYNILEDADLISSSNDHSLRRRTATPLPETRSSAEKYHEILATFPLYRPDHRLLNITGCCLADCLSGRTDPLRVLFQQSASIELLKDVYVSSPMFGTGNKMLGDFLHRLVPHHDSHSSAGKLQILEIGAGTGATTQYILDQLLASGIEFTYVVTDVSVALVSAAQKTFNAREYHHYLIVAMYTLTQFAIALTVATGVVAEANLELNEARPDKALPITGSLLGLSIEADRFPDWSGPFGEQNEFTYRLMNNIKDRTGVPPTIRVGGGSQDYVISMPEIEGNPGFYNVFDPDLACKNVELETLNMGNEADLWGGGARPDSWTTWEYRDQQIEYYEAITKELGDNGRKSRIGDVASRWSAVQVLKTGILDTTMGSLISYISAHRYQGGSSMDPPSRWAGKAAILISKSWARERLSQYRSISGHGQSGVSNAAASAIWMVDYSLQAAAMGIKGLQFHQGIGYNYSAFQPIDNVGVDIETFDPDARHHTMPQYHGFLVMAEAIGNSGKAFVNEIETDDPIFDAYEIWEGAALHGSFSSTLIHGQEEGLTWGGEPWETNSGEPEGRSRHFKLNDEGQIVMDASSVIIVSFRY
ncbi:Polyketide synthase [Paramyrothecium foliicola]|nr:Polyketide synthase [Paramyrothecium foliicola]